MIVHHYYRSPCNHQVCIVCTSGFWHGYSVLYMPLLSAVFNKVIEGKFFLLQNAAHTELYLALSNDNKFSVKGMVSVG